MSRSRTAALVVCLTSFVVVSCGSDDHDDMAQDTASAATGTPAPGAEFNDADVAFAQGMIPHHQQAVEMADMALDPATQAGAEVLDLAGRIKAAQDPEIQTLTSWLTNWGAELPSEDHGMDTGGEGMMSETEMEALDAASGEAFDTMWMGMMIAHHQGAIEMSNTEVASGSNPGAKALAQTIITAQQAEIDEMNGLLAG